MKHLLRLLLLLASLHGSAQKALTLFVGTYTRTPGRAGIFVYRFDTATQQATLLDTMIAVNPSYLAPSRDGNYLYAVSEQGGGKGAVGAYRFQKNKLTLINQVSSEGDDPCYVSVDRKGRNLVVANYSGGSLALFPVAPDGGVAPAEQVFRYNGSSLDKQRQEKPHLHSVVLSPGEDYLLAADLGTDFVRGYRFSTRKHALTELKDPVRLDIGTGPRHITFHPKNDWVYVLGELSGRITACRFHDGRLSPFQKISLMPEDSTAAPHSADLHVSPDGAFLYASNRAPTNHIAIFRIDPQSGQLSLVGMQPTGGRVPRNFTLDPSGNFLLAANQDSDRITIFRVDKTTGLLTDTGKSIQVPSPVCLKWSF